MEHHKTDWRIHSMDGHPSTNIRIHLLRTREAYALEKEKESQPIPVAHASPDAPPPPLGHRHYAERLPVQASRF